MNENILKQYSLMENNSKIYYNGSIWDSKSCGKFTIIGKTDRHNGGKNSYVYCLCEFEDGAIIESDFTNIKNGNVKSPNSPNVYGVGYMGQGDWSSKNNGKTTKEYSTWIHMIRRCYSENFQKENMSYKDVTVDKEWFCFQNFCKDIQSLPGYKEWKLGETGYELDKDILCEKMNIHPKIYSFKTCMFVSKKDNVSESTSRKNLTGLTYIGISPEGKEYEFVNQKDFALTNNLNNGNINACLHNIRESHKGWTFKIK